MDDATAWARFDATDAAAGARFRALRAVTGPFNGLLKDVLSSWLDRAHDAARTRAPLGERLELLRGGRPERIVAILHGTAAWVPPPHAAERLVHLQGTAAWHTSGPVSVETPIPFARTDVVAVRRPSRVHAVEALARTRKDWVAADLRGEDGGAAVLTHRADLALLAVTFGWRFPQPDTARG